MYSENDYDQKPSSTDFLDEEGGIDTVPLSDENYSSEDIEGDMFADDDYPFMKTNVRGLENCARFEDIFEHLYTKIEKEPEDEDESDEDKTEREERNEYAVDKNTYLDNILRGIYAKGYEKPTPIQRKAIKQILNGTDIIAQAQSGLGKTATFLLGILGRIDHRMKGTQAVVVAHTRELAKQIYKDLSELLSDGLRKIITIGLFTGGNTSMRRNKYGSSKQKTLPHENPSAQILICTPGRLIDYMNKKLITLDRLKLMCIDEADEMLSFGFQDQVKDIFKVIPEGSQVCLFSATFPEELLEMVNNKNILIDPVKILLNRSDVNLEGISQYYVYFEDMPDHRMSFFDIKCNTLEELMNLIRFEQIIIFCNTKETVQDLAGELLKPRRKENKQPTEEWPDLKSESNEKVQDEFYEPWPVIQLHSDLQQDERNKVMTKFRSGSKKILITTDMLSRGIDVQQVSLVINFDLTRDLETYMHRVGRSGRFGRKGCAINFVRRKDMYFLEKIKEEYQININVLPEDLSAL